MNMSDEMSKKFRKLAMNASLLQAIEEPEPMDDNCPAARIGELGNQVHNLGCDYQNDEDLSDELGQVAVTLWDLAKKVASFDQNQLERDCARQNRISEMKEQANRVGLMSMGSLEMKKPEWNGTGRPPVGTACECDWTESGRYEPAVVKFVGSMIIVVECDGSERVVYVEDADRHIRPIQTQGKTEREELIRIATQVLNHDDVLTERDAAEALYDAGMLMRAGE